MRFALWALIGWVALVASVPVFAFDFMERPAAVLLSPEPEQFAVGRGGFAQSTYHANIFLDTEIDRFQVGAYAHHGIVDVPRGRVGLFYSTYMLNGPVNPGDSPGAEAAQWMMNAVQFEYGFVGTYEVTPNRPLRAALVAEYSRRSYHPLRSGFEDPAADILRAGVVLRDVTGPGSDRLTTDWAARFSWSELYEFWGAPGIDQPRALYTVHLGVEATVETRLAAVKLFAVGMPDVILLRDGGVEVDLALQGGVRLGSGIGSAGGAGRVELFLDYYRSDDTEQRVEASPAELLGYGIRFVLESD
ncbi:MAG: hypothetical protein WD492_03660 [Alkalispirochaeta sp.]